MTLVAAVLAPVLLITALFVAIARTTEGRLADVDVDGDELVVRPLGASRWWALTREIRAPLTSVTDVAVRPAAELPLGLRTPGTQVPGGLIAGSYGLGRTRSFWLVHRRRNDALVIDLADHAYARLVLDVPDAEAVATTIRRASPRTTAR